MADDAIGKAFVELGVRDGGTSQKLAGVRSMLEGLSSKGPVIAAGIAAGISAVVTGARAAVSEFMKAQDAQMNLAGAIAVHGGIVADLVPKYAAFASELQKTTTYTDEQVAGLQALAANYGLLGNDADRAVKAAMGFSRAYGVDATNAMRSIGRGVNGVTRGLKMFGVDVSSTASTQEILNSALDRGGKLFLLESLAAETASGRMKMASKAWSEFKETVGQFVYEKMGVGSAIKFIGDTMRDHLGGADLTKESISAIDELRSRLGGIKTINDDLIGQEDKKAAAAQRANVSFVNSAELWKTLQEYALMHGEGGGEGASTDRRGMMGRTHHPGRRFSRTNIPAVQTALDMPTSLAQPNMFGGTAGMGTVIQNATIRVTNAEIGGAASPGSQRTEPTWNIDGSKGAMPSSIKWTIDDESAKKIARAIGVELREN